MIRKAGKRKERQKDSKGKKQETNANTSMQMIQLKE